MFFFWWFLFGFLSSYLFLFVYLECAHPFSFWNEIRFCINSTYTWQGFPLINYSLAESGWLTVRMYAVQLMILWEENIRLVWISASLQ